MKLNSGPYVSDIQNDVASVSDYNQAVSARGNNAIAVAAGNLSVSSATAENGIAIATGNYAQATALGKNLAIAWGNTTKAKGIKGSHLLVMEEDETGLHMSLLYVDGDQVKENTWYRMKNGVVVQG